MNKPAQRFGVFFSDGYLHDTSENYGIYSNVFEKLQKEHCSRLKHGKIHVDVRIGN